MSVKVKICGIKTVEDALFCEAAGANAIGLVFYKPSPRHVDISTAAKIADSLPPFISVVGLFVNPSKSAVETVLEQVRLDCLQFHGNETNDFCNGFNRKWIKAIKAKPGADLTMEIKNYPNAAAILIDSFDLELAGGSGKTFDWNLLPKEMEKPLILAGGLNEDNVSTAISTVKPWAVDVSGGVEISKGQKDTLMIKDFINRVKQ